MELIWLEDWACYLSPLPSLSTTSCISSICFRAICLSRLTLSLNASRISFFWRSKIPLTLQRDIISFCGIYQCLNSNIQLLLEKVRCEGKGKRRSFHAGYKIECFYLWLYWNLIFSPWFDSFNYKQLTLDCNILSSCNNKTVQSNETDCSFSQW